MKGRCKMELLFGLATFGGAMIAIIFGLIGAASQEGTWRNDE